MPFLCVHFFAGMEFDFNYLLFIIVVVPWLNHFYCKTDNQLMINNNFFNRRLGVLTM